MKEIISLSPKQFETIKKSCITKLTNA
nr:hypothetical protein [Helicobacter suis]